ncbi:hypothetical protein NA57DRAFT_77859 [Rhizodiscina lignyota]|uniref:RBR-type E3 ubiquitin transferase n=1 Tax=Rhizodiscina lignyota TaxID=1504668 RepID=A0A9P4IG76_9PEZI|nr:hypothetical protein NA57DRAFT_77859 [Rhizodiscina lignyota]
MTSQVTSSNSPAELWAFLTKPQYPSKQRVVTSKRPIISRPRPITRKEPAQRSEVNLLLLGQFNFEWDSTVSEQLDVRKDERSSRHSQEADRDSRSHHCQLNRARNVQHGRHAHRPSTSSAASASAGPVRPRSPKVTHIQQTDDTIGRAVTTESGAWQIPPRTTPGSWPQEIEEEGATFILQVPESSSSSAHQTARNNWKVKVHALPPLKVPQDHSDGGNSFLESPSPTGSVSPLSDSGESYSSALESLIDEYADEYAASTEAVVGMNGKQKGRFLTALRPSRSSADLKHQSSALFDRVKGVLKGKKEIPAHETTAHKWSLNLKLPISVSTQNLVPPPLAPSKAPEKPLPPTPLPPATAPPTRPLPPVPTPNGPTTCTACMTELPRTSFPTLTTPSCRHPSTTCKDCLSSWISASLDTTPPDQLTCPYPSCGSSLSENEVRIYADEEVYARYDTLITTSLLSAMPGFRWCIKPGCRSGQIHPSSSGPIFKCHSCGFKSCTTHNVKWHKGETCEEYTYRKDPSQRRAEEEASERMLESTTKACPGRNGRPCGWRIEKNDGCDHMTCRKCKAEFCWLCFADYDPIRRKGNSEHRPNCRYHSKNLRAR